MGSRFRFNLRFKTAGEFFGRICALGYYAAGARLLGADGFGLFSLAFSYAMLASVVIDVGTQNVVTRELARDRANAASVIRAVSFFKLLISPLAVGVVYLLVSKTTADSSVLALMRVTALIAIGNALTEHLSSVLSGLERMEVEAVVKVLSRFGTLLFSVLAFLAFRSVKGFAAGTAAGIFVAVVFGFWWLHRNVSSFSGGMDRAVLARVLRAAAPLFAAALFVAVYNNQDRFILSYLKFADRDIGVYSASAKLIDALRPLPILLMGAVFPIVSELSFSNVPLFERIASILVRYSILALFPFAFGVTVFAHVVVGMIFGPQYADTVPVLRVAIWGFAAVFLNHLFLHLFLSRDQQKRYLFAAVLLLVSNALLCWIFYQRWGVVGGAWAMLASEGMLLVVNVAASGWIHGKLGATFLRPGLIAAGTAVCYLVGSLFVPAPLAFGLALILYLALVWRGGLLEPDLLRRFVF